MENHDDTIPRKKKEKNRLLKRRRIKNTKEDASGKGRTYGIDRLNLAETVHEGENDSVHEEENASGNDSK